MAILRSPSGVVEIRLQKPTIPGERPKFFKEWSKRGDFYSENFPKRHTRFLTPEKRTFTLSITLKKGFVYGENFQCVVVQVIQLATAVKLVHKVFSKTDCEKENSGLKNDTVLQVICVAKKSSNGDLDTARLLSCDLFLEGIQEYNFRSESRGSSFTDGLSIIVRKMETEGDGEMHLANLELHLRNDSYIKNYDMIEGAERLEYCLWDTLTPRDREQAFKKLQEHDGQFALQQRSVAAGADLDPKALKRRLRGENPLLSRPWSSLRVDERRPCFQRLQDRRAFWDRGETPLRLPDPEIVEEDDNDDDDDFVQYDPLVSQKAQSDLDNEAANSKPAQSSKPDIPQPNAERHQVIHDHEQEAAESISPIERPNEGPAVPNAEELPAPIIKQNSKGSSCRLRSSSYSTPIVIDDSDDELPHTYKSNPVNPQVIEVDDSDYDIPQPRTKKRSMSNVETKTIKNKQNFEKGKPVKKTKVEPEVGSSGGADDSELQRLQEEKEREEEELVHLQRIAELYRNRNQREARIAALKAKSGFSAG